MLNETEGQNFGLQTELCRS